MPSGGAAEAFAGGALAVSTGWTGVGAVGGVVVGLHGLDQLQAGLRQAFTGEEVDSFTSQGLQAAGLSRCTANLVDAGISVVGSLGAGVATASIKVATIRASDPLAKGLSTAQILWRTEVGSQALSNSKFASLGGASTTPLAKAASLSGPGFNIGKAISLAGTGPTPLANAGIGAIGAGGAAGSAAASGSDCDCP